MSNNQRIEAMRGLVQNMLAGIHTAAPGELLSYSPATGRATVKPLVKFRIDLETVVDAPPVVEVPVVWPSGSGGQASVTFPLQPGDGVLVVFSERALDSWLNGGYSQDPRQYDLTDAIAIPGLYPTAIPAVSTHPDDLCLYHGGTVIRIKKGGNVIISGGDLIVGGVSFLNHVHGGIQPGGGTTSEPQGGA